jgi:anaerobic magnesium-protoporphyrin IX monomethyl ester cyclase
MATHMKVLFIEPPRDFWFVMGEYLPPPFGLIQLASYLENAMSDVEIEIFDCLPQQLSWRAIERKIESFQPDIVGVSAFAASTVYSVLRTLEIAKTVNSRILTVTGGQHFSVTAQDSLAKYPEIDVIVRGEGEETFTELVRNCTQKPNFSQVYGISYRHNETIIHNKPRPLLPDLKVLPYPGYHFVEDLIQKYHFAAMAGYNAPYALIEGARGCTHNCTFCTQWRHWGGICRQKTPERIADEIEFCYQRYGSRFIWLTDDNFGSGNRANNLADALIKREIGDDLMLFLQWRCDDVVQNRKALPKLRKAHLYWVMMGVESPKATTLQSFRKELIADQAHHAVRLLKNNGIFSHAMFMIGERHDTRESIADLREFANQLDPDFAIFTALTPFPGTEIYGEALRNGWIEDFNLSHYDMAHAIMPTTTLSRIDVQEELYNCYRSFYGSWRRRFGGIFSTNKLKSHLYRHMMGQNVLQQLKNLIQLKV